MQLSSDEIRALAFIGGLIGLSVLGRWVDRPREVMAELPAVDLVEMEKLSGADSGAGAGSGVGVRGRGSGSGSGSVDINTAGVGELERLPGIGPALAGRIVAYRDSVRGFRSVEELDSVKGVGPALLGRLKPLVHIGQSRFAP